MIDQKRAMIELKPGYHLVIRVVAKVVDINKDSEKYDVFTRKCKLPHETYGMKLLKNYSKAGCEFECAMNASMTICKCLPWHYPNNFTHISMCDMFGAKCFDMIMSDERYYRNCTSQCLEDCKGVSYVPFPSYIPLNNEEICENPVFKDIFKYMYSTYEQFLWFEYFTLNKPHPDYYSHSKFENYLDYSKCY